MANCADGRTSSTIFFCAPRDMSLARERADKRSASGSRQSGGGAPSSALACPVNAA